MAQCEVKKGIFILQPCNEFAGIVCTACGIHICSTHGHQMGPAVYCPECAFKSEKENASKLGNKQFKKWEDGLSTNYSKWYQSVRHGFFSTGYYVPFNSNDYTGFTRHSSHDLNDELDSGNYIES